MCTEYIPGCSSPHSFISTSADDDDGIYFTEDNIPVRTIYLSGLRKSTTESTIRSYFKAEEVESIRIYSSKNYSNAFVTFNSAENAGRVLSLKHIVIAKKEVKVFRADSWHQPKIITENDTEIDLKSSLLILNDDCIFKVFKYLDAVDLCSLSRTCRRLHNLTETVLKRFVNFNFDTHIDNSKNVSLMVIRDVLSIIGKFIVNLNISSLNVISPNHRYLALIVKYCKNIEQLTIEEFPINLNAFRNLKNAFPKLKSLEIKHCTGLDDTTVTLFTTPAQLQTLKIINSYEFKGHCLSNFINLETIMLRDCKSVNEKYLKNFFELCPNLKSLSVTRCDALQLLRLFEYLSQNLNCLEFLKIDFLTPAPIHLVTDTNFKKLRTLEIKNTSISLEHLISRFAEKSLLEELDLSGSNFDDDTINAVIKFTNLRILKLNNQYVLKDNIIIKLAESLTTLKQFECRNSSNITDAAIPKFVELCKMLEILDLTSCTLLTVLSVTKTIDILKKQKRPKLEMKMGDTGFDVINDKVCPFADSYTKVTTDMYSFEEESYEDNFYNDISDGDFFENENYLDDVDNDDNDYDLPNFINLLPNKMLPPHIRPESSSDDSLRLY